MTLVFGVDVQGWNSKQGNPKIMMEGKQNGVGITSTKCFSYESRDNEVYPYQRTPMGNPYINPILRGYFWVSYLQESQGWTPAKYHGSTRTWTGYTRPCPLNEVKYYSNRGGVTS